MNEMADAALGHNRQAPYDLERVRQDFPILRSKVHDRPLVYLDNVASAQKPQAVIIARGILERRYQSLPLRSQ